MAIPRSGNSAEWGLVMAVRFDSFYIFDGFALPSKIYGDLLMTSCKVSFAPSKLSEQLHIILQP